MKTVIVDFEYSKIGEHLAEDGVTVIPDNKIVFINAPTQFRFISLDESTRKAVLEDLTHEPTA